MNSHASITKIIHQKNASEFKRRRLKLPSIAMTMLLCELVVSATLMGSTAQAQTDATQIAVQHPGWVVVPGALVRPDCVHQIPNGAGPRIENGRDTGDVSLNGVVIAHYDPCPEDATIRFAEETRGPGVISNSTGSGLVEASYWDDTSLASSDDLDLLTNNLTVPTKPSKNGAVILLYSALQDSTGGYVLAATLQYGDNFGAGGNYWSILGYIVTPGGTYMSADRQVYKGDSLSITAQAEPTYYSCGAGVQDNTILNGTSLAVSYSGLHWTTAFSGALSVGNLSSCSEFPATQAVFTDTVVDHGWPSYKKTTPKWVGATYAYGGPSCGFSVTPGNKTTLEY